MSERPPAHYTTGQAAKAAGISRSMLRWLWNRGLAVPSVRNSRKGGSSSLWSEADVRAIAMAVRMRREIEDLSLADRLSPIRLSKLRAKLLVVGTHGVSEVQGKTTVAQLLRSSGGSPVAVVRADL